MDIIHVMNGVTYNRAVEHSLEQRLKIMPAVVVTGARQTGKSTLAQKLTPGERRFYTLDDLDVLESARRDPDSLVGGTRPVTLDEVQREPSLLLAVKRSIDQNKRAGQFLITGSANLLLMGKVSESLAGRASYLTLWPMSRREQLGQGRCGIWEELLDAHAKDWPEIVTSQDHRQEDWRELALRGGFPNAAIELKTHEERGIWFEGYIKTYLERDLQDIAAIDALPDFRRLMRAVCHRLGALVNQTEMGRDISIPQPTVHRYLNLLETSYMLIRLPAYSVNRTKRLIKSPKFYWADTGLALDLAERQDPGGEHLENIVLNDLLVWRDSRTKTADIFYWRTHIGEEVDLVIESGGHLLPIEVKTTARPRLEDARHLRSFRKEYADRSLPGLLLHTGDTVDWITPDVLAAPWWKIL